MVTVLSPDWALFSLSITRATVRRFAGYYLIEAGNGVLSSLGLFQTSEQDGESTKVVSKWIIDENFNTAIPNAPKITSGKVVAHSNGVAVA